MLDAVLKKNTGVWAAVYQDVQSKLRTRFGMELVELRARAEAETIMSVSTFPICSNPESLTSQRSP